MYAGTHVCLMHVCLMHICMYVCVSSTYIYIYMYTYVCMYMHACTYVLSGFFLCVCLLGIQAYMQHAYGNPYKAMCDVAAL